MLWLALVLIAVKTNAAKQESNATIPALIVFGDSIMDTGNNNGLHTILKCNFPPYGKDFPGGYATGRFSDGRVPSDLIAEKLGLTKTLPAYMSPDLKPEDLLQGVTFASGGTGYDPLTAKMMQLSSYELSPALDSLDKELDGVIFYINVYDTLLDIIQNPEKYGFEVADRGCCGKGTVAISYLCNSLNPFTCSNSSAYVFWDSYHPTERAYQVIVDKLLDKYLSKIY
ncbi:hypothetical protein YC2023_106664 [Brassica napus]